MSASNAGAKAFRRCLRLALHLTMILAIAISIVFMVVRLAHLYDAPAPTTTGTISSEQ
jgi:hypothetical protein